MAEAKEAKETGIFLLTPYMSLTDPISRLLFEQPRHTHQIQDSSSNNPPNPRDGLR